MLVAFEPHLQALHAKQTLRCQNIRGERSSAHGRPRTSNPESRWHVVCRGVSHNIIEELADAPGSPFHKLGLMEHREVGGYDGALRRQVVQLRHLKADPSALALQAAPDWSALFSNCSRPLVVDLGCGAGRCMLAAAVAQEAQEAQGGPGKAQRAGAGEAQGPLQHGRIAPPSPASLTAPTPQATEESGKAQAAEVDVEAVGQQEGVHVPEDAPEGRPQSPKAVEEGVGCWGGGGGGGGANFLGVEVRLALTSRANAWAQQLGVQHRLAFLCANANASLVPLLQSYSRTPTSQHTAPLTPTPPPTPPPPRGAVTSTPTRPHGAPDLGDGHVTMGMGPGGPAIRDDPGSVEGACRHKEEGRVRLVCLQFSDPPVRREALLGGEELVAQLAGALQPGALVWIQTDVSSIATSLRRLFWSNGGFAPSIRHSAARGTTRTRHWLPEQQPAVHPPPLTTTPPSPPSSQPATTGSAHITAPARTRSGITSKSEPSQPQPPATTNSLDLLTNNSDASHRGYKNGSSMGDSAAFNDFSSRPGDAAGSEATSAATGNDAMGSTAQETGIQSLAAASDHLPLLLLEADLATHREPWLADKQVAALVAVRRGAGGDGGSQRDEEEERGAAGEVRRRVTVEAGQQGNDDHKGGEDEGGEERKGDLVGGGIQVLEQGLVCLGVEADGWAGLPWLDANPLGVPTEREVYVERGGRYIYRLLLVRR